ncbi:hypothetical protein ACQ4M3_06410 [Leptolyngbya sp. AN03gr2]|uniref:hypothetical protein n=1 Tax=unclassified Leptolyngbya TaxID=2650499 RepID=UPI003D3131F7
MTQQKKSATVTRAQLDLANLQAIDPTLDLGDGLSVKELNRLVQETQDAIAQFNIAAATIANNRRLIREKENAIADLSQRLRLGVGARYGKNSSEYQLANRASKRGRNGKLIEKPVEENSAPATSVSAMN